MVLTKRNVVSVDENDISTLFQSSKFSNTHDSFAYSRSLFSRAARPSYWSAHTLRKSGTLQISNLEFIVTRTGGKSKSLKATVVGKSKRVAVNDLRSFHLDQNFRVGLRPPK